MSLTSLRSARPDTTLRYILIPHAGVSFVLFHEAFTRQIWSNVIVSPAFCSKTLLQPTYRVLLLDAYKACFVFYADGVPGIVTAKIPAT